MYIKFVLKPLLKKQENQKDEIVTKSSASLSVNQKEKTEQAIGLV